MTDDDEQVIPLVAEVAVIEKRMVDSGLTRIKIRSSEYDEHLHEELLHETVEITRIPFDLRIETIPLVRREGDLTIIPIFEEVLHIEKRLILKEEIHIRHIQTAEMTEVSVSLRKEEAFVEHLDADTKMTTNQEQSDV